MPAPLQLLPLSDEAHVQSDVSVTCASSDLVVRVKREFYGLGADASELRLGSTCQSNGVIRPDGDLLFTYPLTQCDGALELLPGHLVYKFVLRFVPSPGHFPSKAHPLTVNIECRYQRNHYMHKLAIRPTWETRIVHKRLRTGQTNFQIQLMDDTWKTPVKSRVFKLGETVKFQVSAPHLPPGRKLYINSCYVTPVTHSKSNVKYTIIDNYGCLTDSKAEPGASKFITRTNKSVRFSIKAFQFVTDPDSEISMRCQMHVTSAGPSPAHKSCTYTHKRWEALAGDDAICQCCDSRCVTSKRQRAMMDGITSSRSLWVSSHPESFSARVNPVVDSAEKANNPKQKEENLKETADITYVEINGEKTSDLEELKWYMHNPEDEKGQVVESKDDLLDAKPEYERIKLESVLNEKAAEPLDPDGSEIKQVEQSNSDGKVKALDGKDTTWYFTWR
ncbi:zona pellucida sperm-binding protein 3-like [Eucyclogobius newberryi]|uniref:zona pellucida sperm-binding protein 3-like n=1 Tax=Eucyclogobius newberryi TaxID=166745 RepID=UPI003B5CA4C6